MTDTRKIAVVEHPVAAMGEDEFVILEVVLITRVLTLRGVGTNLCGQSLLSVSRALSPRVGGSLGRDDAGRASSGALASRAVGLGWRTRTGPLGGTEAGLTHVTRLKPEDRPGCGSRS